MKTELISAGLLRIRSVMMSRRRMDFLKAVASFETTLNGENDETKDAYLDVLDRIFQRTENLLLKLTNRGSWERCQEGAPSQRFNQLRDYINASRQLQCISRIEQQRECDRRNYIDGVIA